MILPSITGPGRAFLAESCCYMPCLGISNFYRSWIIKVYSIITINRKCRYMFLLVSFLFNYELLQLILLSQ